MDTTTIDWYEILGCSVDSTRGEIEKAVRKLSLKYHSDKTDDPDAPAKFLQVQKAKEILLDDTKRKEIDDVIRAKLKRKENENKKMKEMSEHRKKMKEKLEKSESQAATSNQNPSVNTTKSTTSNIDVNKLNHLKRDAASKMEEFSRQAQEVQDRKRHLSESFKTASSSPHVTSSGASNGSRTHIHTSVPSTASAGGSSDPLSGLPLNLDPRSECQVKIKWKRSMESHSEESLFQLLKLYGSIEDIKLGDKGSSAVVTFTESRSAVQCCREFEAMEDYRVSLVSTDKEKEKVKASVFTYNYNQNNNAHLGSNHNHNGGQDLSRSHPSSAMFRSESELLTMMRRAVEKETLIQSLPSGSSAVGENKYSSVFTNTSTPHPASSVGDRELPHSTGPNIAPILNPNMSGKQQAVGVASSLIGMESDILARMKKKKQEMLLKKQEQEQQQETKEKEPSS